MKLRAILAVCLTASLGFAAVGNDDEIKEIVKRFDTVKHCHQYPELYRSLFAEAGADDLSRLQSLDQDSIAVQSAWEAVVLTVPREQGDKAYRLDSQKVSRFLGFVQGRARISPPDWWQQVVLRARANRRDNIYPGRPKVIPYHRAGVDSVSCPRNAAVEASGDSVLYRVGEDSITIPEEMLSRADSGELWDNISGTFTKKYCFLAVHGDVGYPHDVACIDRSSGRLVWKSTACGCWWGGGTGRHESWVSVVSTSDNRVFVFGRASVGFYFHGFRASDGKSLIHFSSNY